MNSAARRSRRMNTCYVNRIRPYGSTDEQDREILGWEKVYGFIIKALTLMAFSLTAVQLVGIGLDNIPTTRVIDFVFFLVGLVAVFLLIFGLCAATVHNLALAFGLWYRNRRQKTELSDKKLLLLATGVSFAITVPTMGFLNVAVSLAFRGVTFGL